MHGFVRDTLGLLLVVGLLTGCRGGPEALCDAAREALEQGDWSEAVAKARQSQERTDDPRLDWQATQVELLALASGGQGAAALERLELAVVALPQPPTAAFYRQLAGDLRTAGELGAAVEVLHRGHARHPGLAADFEVDLAALQHQPDAGPELLEQLRQLGYLD